MSPKDIALSRQSEIAERRMGMRSLDHAVIAGHFGKAKALRDKMSGASKLLLVFGPQGTKGSWPTVRG